MTTCHHSCKRTGVWPCCLVPTPTHPPHQGLSSDKSPKVSHLQLIGWLKVNNFLQELKKKKKHLIFLAALGLHCCIQAFPPCGEWELFSSCRAQASQCGSFSCCGARAPGRRGSVIMTHGLTCSVARTIFPDQGSNLCALRWQWILNHWPPRKSLQVFFLYSYFRLAIKHN